MLLKDLLDVLKEYEYSSGHLNVVLKLESGYEFDGIKGSFKSPIGIRRTGIDEIMLTQNTDDFDYFS